MAAKKKPLEVKPAALGEARRHGRGDGAAARAVGPALHRRGRRRGARAGAAAPDRSEGAVMASTFAFAETRGGELRKVAFEAVTAARQAADASGGGEVHALVLGAPGIASKADALGRYGADVVVVVEHAGLERYSPEVVGGHRGRAAPGGPVSRRVLLRVGRGARSRAARRREARRGAGVGRDRIRDPGRRARWRSIRRTPARSSSPCVSPGTPAIVSLRPGAMPAAEHAEDRAGRARRARRWIPARRASW